MSVVVEVEENVFDGGPPLRLQRYLGLVRPGEPRFRRRAALAVVVGWLPLVALAGWESVVAGDGAAKSFFFDFAVHARFLLAAPILILAEADCIPRLGRVARHFLSAGFVTEQDRGRYDATVASTRRLLDSTVADLVTVILAYTLTVALYYYPPAAFPAWYHSGSGSRGFSLAGWWHVLVSVPFLLVLFLGWLWRILLWWRFMARMAFLDLRLLPSHPDHVGGLKFVSSSLRGFRLFCFALGVIAAGTVTNRVVHAGESPFDFKHFVIVLLVCILILTAGPLTVFIRRLRSAKSHGTYVYGMLSSEMGREFERKWLGRAGTVDQGALDVEDFSATTDLYQVAAHVYEMKDFPFGLKNLTQLMTMTLLPFVPVALMAMPLKEILQAFAKLLL